MLYNCINVILALEKDMNKFDTSMKLRRIFGVEGSEINLSRAFRQSMEEGGNSFLATSMSMGWHRLPSIRPTMAIRWYCNGVRPNLS